MKKYLYVSGLLFCLTSLIACNLTRDSQQGEEMELRNTHWRLVNMPGELLGEVEVTLSFEGEKISGKSGCNSYFSAYESEGSKLTFKRIGSTRMMCSDMEVERQYLALLGKTATYSISAQQLIIRTPDGDLVFVPKQGE